MSNIRRPVLVMQNGQKRVLVLRPETYMDAVELSRRHFPNISSSLVVFQTKDLDVCGGLLADIDPELWPNVRDLVSVVFVERGNVHRVDLNTPPTYFTNAPAYNETCRGDVLEHSSLRGGKPVIYLNSPTDIGVSVAMSLVPEWRFSAIYPVIPIKNSSLGECIEWNVHTHSHDGTLTETNTGLNVAYLFWEAHTDSNLPPSPPRSPILGELAPEHFNPNSPDLCDSNSVVLAVKDITLYLDKALGALGLHTEARTSFITYWLPDLLKHNHVALRFVPRAAYERAAPLVIKPEPDVVTRIFMLFKGVMQESLGEWRQATVKALEDVRHWKDVVGVDLDLALDTQLFRVLEWGGMEVLEQ